jgi:trehalose/maltose hydrolase-like predicted phosphorylase
VTLAVLFRSKRMHSRILPFILFAIATGCSSHQEAATSPPLTQAPADPWVITTYKANDSTSALLWNGRIGVRVSPDLVTPIKSPMFDIDRHDRSGEEKIQPLPNPILLSIDHESNEVQPQTARDFQSTLDMRTGLIKASWTEGEFKIVGEMAIHPTRKVLAQKWTITPSRDASIIAGFGPLGISETIRDIKVEKGGPLDKTEQILSSSGPLWRARTVIERTSTNAPDLVPAHHPITTSITWSFEPGSVPTFDEVAKASKAEWKVRWQTDIELDGPAEDQQAIRSFLFYLRSAIQPGGKMSISPMGLSSDLYGGHVFWDADIWVFPALALIDPERAKAIPDYRNAKMGRAQLNFNQWWDRDLRPTASGKIGALLIEGIQPFGIKFPWESSVSGRETVPGPSKFEDHVTGSIAFAMSQAAALGLARNQAVSVLSGADQFYRTRSKLVKGQFEIEDTMSPDENHVGNNDLYTNLVAQYAENRGSWDMDAVKKHMAAIRMFWAPYKLPEDDKTFLTYDNDPIRGYKQAASVLSIYPLQYPPAEAQAKAMMERFADKVSKNGPAMTDSIHSIIWARLGETDKAYAAWRESWQPFIRSPFLLFSEKRSSSRTYFTTGAAGSLQAVLFGFAGLRIDEKKAPDAQWSMPLLDGKILSIAPHLPKGWKKLTLRNLTILGKRLTFEIEGDRVRVS